MLVLKYDQYRISPSDLVCFHNWYLTWLSKNEVLLCIYVTHSRMHSHIYDHFFTRSSCLILRKIQPVHSLVHGQVRRETKWHITQTDHFSSRAIIILTTAYDHGIEPQLPWHTNQQTRIRPTWTRFHLPCPTTSLGYGDCNACRCSQFAGDKPPHFHERWSMPPFVIFPYLLPCIGWMRFDYGCYVIR